MRSFATVPFLVTLLVLLTSACGGGGGGGGGTPPVAQAMSVSVAKDKARSLVLLGTPATAGNSLVYQVLSSPQYGSLSGTAPNLSFTPTTGYVGADRFDFSVTENGVASVKATVQLLVSDWTEISPSGGFISRAAFHPSRANELWVCADDGGGLYKSVDTGATWTLQQNTPLNWSAYAFVFDPSNSSVLYAPNHFGRGLIKSTDGGVNWVLVGTGLPTTGPDTKRIYDLEVDPANGNLVWVATGNGIYKSTDAGMSFSKIVSATFGNEIDFRGVEVSSSGRVFAASKQGGVYDSQNGGVSWTVIGSPSPTGPILSDLALTSNAVYVTFSLGWIMRATGFLASNYTMINDPLTGSIQSTIWTKIKALSGTSVSQDQLYVGTTWVNGSTKWGFHYSADGGSTYTKRTTGLNGASVFDLVVDPSSPARLLFCSVNDGVFLTSNAGLTWTDVSAGIQAYASLGIAEDPNDSNHLLFTSGAAFPGTSKTLETTNGGQSWSEITNLTNIDLLDIHFAPASSSVLLATTHNAGIYRTTGGTGGTWTKVLTLTKSVKTLVFSKADATLVYAISQNPAHDPEAGIYFSVDTGATWSKRYNNDIPNSVVAFGVLPHPSNRNEVLVMGTDVWVSTDALATGRTGTKSLGLAAAAPGRYFMSAAFLPSSPSTLLVGATSGELYRTQNYSATGTVTWTAISNPAKDAYVNDIHIIEDSQGETWLLTLWMADTMFLPTSTTGVLRSDDQGQTWTFLDADLYPCTLFWKLRQRASSPRSFLAGLWGAAGFYTLDV